jgi:hypothetical protein
MPKRIVTITNTFSSPSISYVPKPAKFMLPKWYKDTDEYIGGKKKVNQDGSLVQTIKKCVPVFDALSLGYIIPTVTDIVVSQTEDGIVYRWQLNGNWVSMHGKWQLDKFPKQMNGNDFPKFDNPWSIKTPKGYSCLFIPPLNNPNPWFEILSGFVDTDTYTTPVNFPFYLLDTSFEGIIPAGTPMAQIVPMKRESWKHKIGDKKNVKEAHETLDYLKTSYFDSYRKKFWQRKDYS